MQYEPDDYLNSQDAGAIALSNWPVGQAGEWNDIDETNTLYFVVEYPEPEEGTRLKSDLKVLSISSLQEQWSQYQEQLGVLFQAKVYNVFGKQVLVTSEFGEFTEASIHGGIYFVEFVGIREKYSVQI